MHEIQYQPTNIDQVIFKKKLPHKEKFKAHTCTRCGKIPSHSSEESPTWNVNCHKHSKKGNFSTFCCSIGSVQAVQSSDHEQDITDNYLRTVKTMPCSNASQTLDSPSCYQYNGLVTTFKIDTRADVTGIPETVFKKISNIT